VRRTRPAEPLFAWAEDRDRAGQAALDDLLERDQAERDAHNTRVALSMRACFEASARTADEQMAALRAAWRAEDRKAKRATGVVGCGPQNQRGDAPSRQSEGHRRTRGGTW